MSCHVRMGSLVKYSSKYSSLSKNMHGVIVGIWSHHLTAAIQVSVFWSDGFKSIYRGERQSFGDGSYEISLSWIKTAVY